VPEALGGRARGTSESYIRARGESEVALGALKRPKETETGGWTWQRKRPTKTPPSEGLSTLNHPEAPETIIIPRHPKSSIYTYSRPIDDIINRHVGCRFVPLHSCSTTSTVTQGPRQTALACIIRCVLHHGDTWNRTSHDFIIPWAPRGGAETKFFFKRAVEARHRAKSRRAR
jgi:hypothetical protein